MKNRGFSLVEMALVLLVMGIMGAMFLPLTNTMIDHNKRQDTKAKLDSLEKAFTRFVMIHRRLPCPANGALLTGNVNEGLEQSAGGVCTALGLNNGVVPWRTLGLVQNDVIDAWGALVTYKVWGVTATALTANDGLDMSGLNPTVSPVVLNWLSVRGFRLCRATPCAPGSASELASKATGNGIAYFLISHGPNKVGAYLPGGTFSGAASGAGPGPLENINRNNLALRTISPNDFYVDALFDENPASYYDDLVLHPSIIKVASDAGLQPKNP